MERISVHSSNVAEVGYDPETMTLEVMFHNGSIYQYFQVPQSVYEKLILADSVGGFLNSQIKNLYEYVQL